LRTFIDTSVFIARHAHSPTQAQKVESATGAGSGRTKVSGLVVRQELKRRMLGDAEYLFRLLDEKNGFEEALHHLNRLRQLPYQANRAGICLGLMASITGVDDQDKTDRLKAKLRRFILTCLAKFDGWVDHLERGSGCHCATLDPVERKKRGGRVVFEMGDDKCGTGGTCHVGQFLTRMSDSSTAIQSHLAATLEPNGRKELHDILAFLNDTTSAEFTATDRNPCLTVGDLLIALESVAANCAEMYTMNHRDSLPLCAALGQQLRILSHKPEVEDVVVPPPASAV